MAARTRDKTADPFYTQLERFIGEVIECKPDAETLKAWAAKYPDKFGSLLAALYRARDGANPSVGTNPALLSDSELQDAVLADMKSMMDELGYDMVERPRSNVEEFAARRRLVHES